MGGDEPSGQQQRVTRQEEADEERGLREDDREQHGVRVWAELLQEMLRTQQRLHDLDQSVHASLRIAARTLRAGYGALR